VNSRGSSFGALAGAEPRLFFCEVASFCATLIRGRNCECGAVLRQPPGLGSRCEGQEVGGRSGRGERGAVRPELARAFVATAKRDTRTAGIFPPVAQHDRVLRCGRFR
jgi:hypothetical protein